ncbi:hypothetical protein B7494_g4152 [Chlorociboria aeruginascens]|nr:hypothetical protein B7494_g4152 [Chlorociboria aeruginascens]
MSPGANAAGGPSGIWIGNDGPTLVEYTNDSSGPIILVIWTKSVSATNKRSTASIIPAGFVEEYNNNTPVPAVTWSLANGESVTVSMANSVSAGWAALYNHQTGLTGGYGGGQIDNTWGEITTYIPNASNSSEATTDVSRLINNNGNTMTITVKGGENPGCVADMTRCSYTCPGGASPCTYGGLMLDCQASDQAYGAKLGPGDGGASGGCQGFNSNGVITVSFS